MSAKRAITKKQVTFTCKLNSKAKSVCLAGDFNDWQPAAGKMTKAKSGAFQLRMRLEPGAYQYKFVVDGVWFNDPKAAEQMVNSHGTLNSVVRVG